MRIGDIDVNVYDRGSGRAVLFLHGWGSEFEVFRTFLERLGGFYRVCALDLPGFGKTGEPPVAWNLDDYADFVLDFLAELRIPEVILIGHSFGGRISIKLASRKDLPVKIPKVVLVDSAGIRPPRTLRQKLRSMVYRLGRRILETQAIRKRYPDLPERWRRKHGSADYRNATPRMRECLVRVVGEDLTPCLPSIDCPTLLIWGGQDTATPVSDARIMEKLIPDAGLVVLEGAGHYSFLDSARTFGRVLDSFLNIDRKGE